MFGFGKLNVAIMGTGYMAGVMAETLQSVPSVRTYAVASRDMERALEFGREYGFKKAYGSYAELAADKKVDLVYIATPHSEHYRHVRMCLENGRAVLCEKPFALNADMAQELFTLAEERGVFAAEAMWIRFLPFAAKIKEVLQSNVIGDPVMLEANLGYNVGRITRMIDPALGGGALLDIGVYLLNVASMLFGDDVRRVNSHCTYTDRHLDEQESITLRYGDGKMAVLQSSMVGISDRRAVISGTKGYMVIENVNNFETLTVFDSSYNRIGSYRRPRQKTGYEYEIKACVRALKEQWTEVPEMTHAQTMNMMHLLDYIRGQLGVVYPQEQPAEETAEPAEALPEGAPEIESVVAEPVFEEDTLPGADPAEVEAAMETAAAQAPAEDAAVQISEEDTETEEA